MTSVPVKMLKRCVQPGLVITTTEMHTGGEPVRIIESGYPEPQGKTILDKIEDLRKNYDDYRKFVILEPHGHYDMYGVLLVDPDNPDADIAAIFLHNEGYSTMCGHACIALGRYAVDRGLVSRDNTSPKTRVNIQVPCGLVSAYVTVSHDDDNKSGSVSFESVPSFVVCEAAAIDAVPLWHPETPAFLYGTMIVDSRYSLNEPSTNLCVFANQEVDRSPCGSGTSARVALMYHRGLLKQGQGHIFMSRVTGSEFKVKAIMATTVGAKEAVVVEVEGQSFYIGNSTMTLEDGDSLGRGFVADSTPDFQLGAR